MTGRLKQQTGLAVIATATVWFSLIPWSGFAEAWRGYIYPLLGMGLVLTLVGALVRSLTRLRTVVVAAQLLVTAGLLQLALVHTWRVNGTTLDRWRDELAAAVEVAQTYRAPIPEKITDLAPLMLVLGLTVFLAFDFLALTLRRPAAAGLLLLATLTAVASVLDEPIGWIPFLLTAVSFVGLLGAVHESVIRGWAMPGEDDDWSDSRGPWQLSSRTVSLRIGLGATCLAVVAPLVLPTLGNGVIDSLKTGSGTGPGGSGLGLRSPLLDMRRNLDQGTDIPLVDVLTKGSGSPRYFRIAVLDGFTGAVWLQGERTSVRMRTILPVPGLATQERAAPVVTYDVHTLASYDGTTFPLPYPPGLFIDGRQPLSVDTATWEVSTDDPLRKLSDQWVRTTEYLQPIDTQRLVDAPPAPVSIFEANTGLPPNVPDWVAQTAARVTAGATSDFEKAVLLQRWFRFSGGFSYSLRSSTGSGLEQLEKFLGSGADSKVGYCEQFATAMTLLARAEGIPARVVIGFLDADQISPGVWQFSAHDLHAWPEIYFSGTGWVRFEPTPAARTGLPPEYTLGFVPPPAEPVTESPSSAATRPTDPNTAAQESPTAAPGEGTPGAGGGSIPWIAYLPILLLAGTTPRGLAWAVKRWRWRRAVTPRARAEAGWRQVNDVARDLGLSLTDTQTVRSRLRYLLHHLAPTGHRPGDVVRSPDEDAARRLTRVASAVETARYAPHHEPEWISEEDVRACIEALRRASGDRRRHRATWLPKSVFSPVG